MELKPGYKQTEIGVIPEDWQVRAFRDLGESHIGLTYKPSDVRSDGTLVLRSSNIQEDSLRFDDNVFVTSLVPERLMARPGDILICVRNGSRDLIGKCAHLDDRTLGMTFGAFMTVFRSDAHDFVYQQMRSDIVKRQITEHLGATINQITNKSLNSFEIPLPPTKAEQQKIAEALSDADALIESLQQLLAKKRQIKQGTMQELFTGKKRLPGFSGDWIYKRLGDLGRWTGGMTPSMRNQDYWHMGTVPWISSGDVKSSRLHTTAFAVSADAIRDRATTVVPANSIVIVTRSGILRKYLPVAMNMISMAINQDIKALIPAAAVLPDYLLHALIHTGDSILARCMKSGTTVESIEFAWLKSFEIPVPHLSEQLAISVVLNDLHADIDALETKLSKARQLKQGMAQELLTGRIRLVRPSAHVLSFPVKESASVAKDSHNTQINEAVVIGVLSAKFGSEKFPLGRFRRTKFSYLLHRHVERDAAGFMKKAAGPYNPRTRYGGAEKIALQNRYVRVLSTGKSEGFVADENIAQAESYFDKWYGAEALTWLEQFRYQKNDALELLTTVDMACEDLSRAGKAATLSAVKQIIHKSPEWKAKLNRAVFSDDNIATTIQSCGQLFPIEEE